MYKFLKKFANKKKGEVHRLHPSLAANLIRREVVEKASEKDIEKAAEINAKAKEEAEILAALEAEELANAGKDPEKKKED